MPLFPPNIVVPSDPDLLPLMINVKDAPYNAKGDGLTNPNADDTIAIAHARSDANKAGGGWLFYPPGKYVTGNQTLYNNVHTFGSGKGVTTISLKNGANTDLFSALTSSINLAGAIGTGSSIGVNY